MRHLEAILFYLLHPYDFCSITTCTRQSVILSEGFMDRTEKYWNVLLHISSKKRLRISNRRFTCPTLLTLNTFQRFTIDMFLSFVCVRWYIFPPKADLSLEEVIFLITDTILISRGILILVKITNDTISYYTIPLRIAVANLRSS